MVLRKKSEKKSKQNVIRIVLTDDLADELQKVKKIAKEKGYVFDVKPDVFKVVKKSIQDALKEIETIKES